VTLDEELRSLRAEGRSRDDDVWVAHYFIFFQSSRGERRSLREALLAVGLGTGEGEVGADEELTGDGYWHLWAFTLVKATEQALLGADAQARAVAESHGARYDEWSIMRGIDGTLRALTARDEGSPGGP
jgi:hypothetical protein